MVRQKNKVTELISREQAEQVIQDYAESSSKIKGIESELEQAIQKIREGRATELVALKGMQQDAMDKLQYFAEFNKTDLFGKKKSLELAHGVIGFRIGTPKVKTVGTTLAKAFAAVKAAGMKSFIRTKEELDRDEIINMRSNDKVMSKLRAIGLEVVQDESFYVESKEEEYS